jgi:hypothetical protein
MFHPVCSSAQGRENDRLLSPDFDAKKPIFISLKIGDPSNPS